MIVIQGYNTRLKQKVELLINEDGAILGLERWKNIRTGSVKRYTEQKDIEGKMLFEDDVIVSNLNGEEMTIRYGRYNAYCTSKERERKSGHMRGRKYKAVWLDKSIVRADKNYQPPD